MASFTNFAKSCAEFLLFKFPLLDALSLLMLFAERASKESLPPINPKLVYIYLLACIACGVLLSARIGRKEACLVYAGLQALLAVSFYINPLWNYLPWQQIVMISRQLGCVGIFVMLAYIHNTKYSSGWLRRFGEICLGVFLMAYVYLINSILQYKFGFNTHMPGGDYMRYIVVLILAACALSFFSGYFQRDMSLCAAITLSLTTVLVDSDIWYWEKQGFQKWNQIRQIINSTCAVVGFFLLFLTVDNRVKININ